MTRLQQFRRDDAARKTRAAPSDRTRFDRIRCPRCGWRPGPSSTWSCEYSGPPEPAFPSCGAVWNTFATRGRCPGCAHQWQWTSCLACGEWSRHDDWYEPEPLG